MVSNKAWDGSTRAKMYNIHVAYKILQVNNNKCKVQWKFNMGKVHDHIEIKYKWQMYKLTDIAMVYDYIDFKTDTSYTSYTYSW